MNKPFEVTTPFRINSTDNWNVGIVLKLDRIIDSYDYHDFPSEETVYFDKEELLELIEALKNAYDKMK